jgi:hypothetical protein
MCALSLIHIFGTSFILTARPTHQALTTALFPRVHPLPSMVHGLESIVHQHPALDYPLQLLSNHDPFSMESVKNYLETEAGLLQKSDLYPLYFFNVVILAVLLWLQGDMDTLRGDISQLRGDMDTNFTQLRGELAPLQLDVLMRATADATLEVVNDADLLTLNLDLLDLVKPSKEEFNVRAQNNIVNVVWSRGAARYSWIKSVPRGKKVAIKPTYDLKIKSHMEGTRCTFVFDA